MKKIGSIWLRMLVGVLGKKKNMFRNQMSEASKNLGSKVNQKELRSLEIRMVKEWFF